MQALVNRAGSSRIGSASIWNTILEDASKESKHKPPGHIICLGKGDKSQGDLIRALQLLGGDASTVELYEDCDATLGMDYAAVVLRPLDEASFRDTTCAVNAWLLRDPEKQWGEGRCTLQH
eukprot:GHVO01064201.1.p1 GENE.GHVO01064201.1~~GHVO01064201.1.p1  ORF type:complete len:121 (-),score=17.57 GHVO01064201.1:73-435(-)